MRNIFFILFSLFILFLSGIFIFITYISIDLPDIDQIGNRQVNQSTKIYDRTGDILLFEIHGEEKRTIIPFDEIPDIVKKATIAAEDNNFYNHIAFDWKALVRSAWIDVVYNKRVGGSTITQQLAKNIFLTSEKKISRKIKELIIALKLEQRYSKDDILSLYLNQIPYGGNAYGIEAASQTYFNKNAKDLTLAEATILVALPQAPTYYSPYGLHRDSLIERQAYVLNQMNKLNYIDDKKVDNALEEELIFAPQATSIKAPHFVMMVIEQLRDIYGEDAIQTGGFKVTTTLDYELQKKAEEVILEGANRNFELYNGRNAALVAQDARTGQILSLVGSFNYFDNENEGNFNVAYQGLRQPGSAFKPFAYLTAFNKGYTPETILFDVDTEFDTTGGPEASYSPGNFDNKYRGPISLRNSLAQSVNVTAVKTLYLAGINDTIDTAEKLGINTLSDRSRFGLSLVLGGGEVRLTELVGAYSVFARDGEQNKQVSILKIEDSLGKVINKWESNTKRVFDAQPVRLLNDVLSDIDARRGLYSSSLGLTTFNDYQVAVKTGTTNDYVDAWTVGYSPSLVVGVWAGNNRREPMQQQGSSLLAALPIWNSFFKEAILNYEPEIFSKPEAINTDKPILRGDYLFGKQIHNILYYLDKDKPKGDIPSNPEKDIQFENWEGSVMSWAQNNIPDFNEYNQGRLYDYISSGNSAVVVVIKSPTNGSFAKDVKTIEAEISAPSNIKLIELYINDKHIHKIEGSLGGKYIYKYNISASEFDLQSKVVIKVTTEKDEIGEASVIVFR